MQGFIIIAVCFLIAASSGEPPKYRSARLQATLAKQENPPPPAIDVIPLIPTEKDIPEKDVTEKSAPYPPSGWKPVGRQLELPTEKEPEATTPAKEYGSPVEVYGPPAEVYGPPAQTYGAPATVPSVESKTVAEEAASSQDSASLKDEENNEDVENIAPVNQQGAYYILLPDSRLQKFYYNIVSDPARMQYSSRIQSLGFQDLSSPLVVYTPEYYQVYQ